MMNINQDLPNDFVFAFYLTRTRGLYLPSHIQRMSLSDQVSLKSLRPVRGTWSSVAGMLAEGERALKSIGQTSLFGAQCQS